MSYKKCKTCRFFRMRYDKEGDDTIPYCMEREFDVNPKDTPKCWDKYRNIN